MLGNFKYMGHDDIVESRCDARFFFDFEAGHGQQIVRTRHETLGLTKLRSQDSENFMCDPSNELTQNAQIAIKE